jgi:hypothetical protein
MTTGYSESTSVLFHTQLHLNSTVIRRTSGRSLGTFESSVFSGNGEELDRKALSFKFVFTGLNA